MTLYEVFNNDSVSLQEEKAANQPTMIRAWKTYRDGDKATAIALYRRQIDKYFSLHGTYQPMFALF